MRKHTCREVCEACEDLKIEALKSRRTIAEQQATIARLEALAYLGNHHFPDLTYKARLEELVLQHRAMDAEIARLTQERDLKAGMLVDALATLARLKQDTPA